MAETFRAVVVDRQDGRTVWRIEEVPVDRLPEGEVLVEVHWSTLNYKDALALTGAGKIIRTFPFVPGIDLSGIVRESTDPRWKPGDRVVLTGWGVGERHWGGLAQLARVRGDWLVPLPEGLTLRDAMTVGTAGFTAALCVMALERMGVRPEQGDLVVTGATGGVGSIAVALLARAGYRVVAVTGKASEEAFLKELGAAEVMDRRPLAEPTPAPLESQRWAGGVDTVGGTVLANILKAVQYRGTVAACGLAGGAELHTTIYPFILRGVRLYGIDSVYSPQDERLEAWRRIARDLPVDLLRRLATEVPLEKAPELAPAFLEGKVKGRIVVRVRDDAEG